MARRRLRHTRPHGPSFAGITEDEISKSTASLLADAGFHPAYIHAFVTTGMLVTEMNLHSWSDADVDEWAAALAEGESLYGAIHPDNWTQVT